MFVCGFFCRVSGHLGGGCLGSWRASPWLCCLVFSIIQGCSNRFVPGLFTCFTCKMGIAPIREFCKDFHRMMNKQDQVTWTNGLRAKKKGRTVLKPAILAILNLKGGIWTATMAILAGQYLNSNYGHLKPEGLAGQSTGRIRFTYPALKVVLKPISWNHQKALFGPKTTSALWPRWNHLIPSNLGPFSHKHNILHPTRRKA